MTTLPNQGDDMGGMVTDHGLIIGAFTFTQRGLVKRLWWRGGWWIRRAGIRFYRGYERAR